MINKRIISLLLTFLMGLGLCAEPAFAVDVPSPWAVEEVNQAIIYGLVPEKLQSNYKQPITRAEFCALAVALYETVTGWAIIRRVRLTDSSDINAEKMAAVGVVSGVSPGRFAPDTQLTREQAATMLAKLTNAVGKPLPKPAAALSGAGTDAFSPNRPFTREQSIVAILRVFYIVKDASSFDASKRIPFEHLTEYYNLTEKEKRLYDQIAAGIANFDLIIEIDAVPRNKKESDMLCRVCDIVYCTHPELFWWDGKVRYPTNANSSGNNKHCLLPIYIVDGKELRSDVIGGNNKIVFPPADEVAAGKAWVERGKADISKKLKGLPVRSGMTPYELELMTHDWLVDKLTYDGSNFSKHEFNTIHGALVDGRVDCNGYSRTFQYIMCLLGIESVVMSGFNRSNEQHMWNAVKLEGEWYQVDITLDGTLRKNEDLPWHFWLNFNDEFRTDKGLTIITDNASIANPDITCTATKYNYSKSLD